jgi:hypothetical protein
MLRWVVFHPPLARRFIYPNAKQPIQKKVKSALGPAGELLEGVVESGVEGPDGGLVVQEVVLHLGLTVDRAVGHLPVARRNPTSSSLGNELDWRQCLKS